MSKFADKIRKASRLEQSAIGFGSARATQVATMVLVGVAQDAAAAAELARKGADAVIVGSQDAAAAPAAKDAQGAVTGAWIGDKGDATTMKAGGYDFVIFDPDRTPSTAVLEEEIGYVLSLPADIGDVELRAIESFQLDAIHVGALENALTVRRQIDLRRIFALTRKPLIAAVPADIASQQLQALRDTNVIAIIASDGAAVERLRKTVDGLPPRSRRKDEDRPTPLVPRTTSGDGDAEEHDHDHD